MPRQTLSGAESDRILIHMFDVEPEEVIDFDPGKLLNVEAIAIERKTGLTLMAVLAGMATGSMTAITAAVWVMRKRANPKLMFEQVVFNSGDYWLEDPDVVEETPLPGDDETSESGDPKAPEDSQPGPS